MCISQGVTHWSDVCVRVVWHKIRSASACSTKEQERKQSLESSIRYAPEQFSKLNRSLVDYENNARSIGSLAQTLISGRLDKSWRTGRDETEQITHIRTSLNDESKLKARDARNEQMIQCRI